MSGFTPGGRRLLGINPESWVVALGLPAGQQAAQVALLRRLDFVAGIHEDLLGSGGVPGVSIVEQFRSSSGARGGLDAAVQLYQNSVRTPARFTAFAVPRIPGARGLAAIGPAGQSGANVAFTKGSYYYLVGAAGPPSGTASVANRAGVIAAAQHLYNRVP